MHYTDCVISGITHFFPVVSACFHFLQNYLIVIAEGGLTVVVRNAGVGSVVNTGLEREGVRGELTQA